MERGFVPLEVGPSTVWPDALPHPRRKEEGRVQGISSPFPSLLSFLLDRASTACGGNRASKVGEGEEEQWKSASVANFTVATV